MIYTGTEAKSGQKKLNGVGHTNYGAQTGSINFGTSGKLQIGNRLQPGRGPGRFLAGWVNEFRFLRR